MTALVGEQLSTFVKTGLPSGNMPKFGTDGEYIKGKDHSEFLLHNFGTSWSSAYNKGVYSQAISKICR